MGGVSEAFRPQNRVVALKVRLKAMIDDEGSSNASAVNPLLRPD